MVTAQLDIVVVNMVGVVKVIITSAVSEGCQLKYGLSSENNFSIEGKCGKEYGSCPTGQCCSKYGWCGTTSFHCDSGCQSEFGKCN